MDRPEDGSEDATDADIIAQSIDLDANGVGHSIGEAGNDLDIDSRNGSSGSEDFDTVDLNADLDDVALEAYAGLEPAAIGSGWARDWDPADEVYRDRRGENNELVVWDDAEPGYGKDPYLHVLDTNRIVRLMEVDPAYQDSNGFLFGMLLTDSWKPPLEFTDTAVAYPLFSDFVSSEGNSSSNWYEGYLPDFIVDIPDSGQWAW